MKVAVVGAGLAGLTCAKELHNNRLEVELFEKCKKSEATRQPGRRIIGLQPRRKGPGRQGAKSTLEKTSESKNECRLYSI